MTKLGIKRSNDKIFRNGSFPEMISETFTDIPDIPEADRRTKYIAAEHTVSETTIGSVLRNAEYRRVAALNFANAMYPGGGYVLGGNAQEESLCRGSLLYYTIKTQKKYYRKNRLHILPDYTHTMIWSENVPVIRNEAGELLDAPAVCGFITCPAVNRSFAKFMMSGKRIRRIMRERIMRIIRLAVMKKPDVLILGAFGCGMFGNRREDVIPLFEEAINKYVPDDMEVIFSIPGGK